LRLDITIPQIMTESEIQALAKTPDVVNVYRGADFQRNVFGRSWSLDQSLAGQFPRLHTHY